MSWKRRLALYAFAATLQVMFWVDRIAYRWRKK